VPNAFGPRKPLFGPYTYRAKQNSNGDTLIAVYVGSKRIAHMDAYWAYSMRSIEDREEEVKQRGRGRSCATDLRALGAEGKYPNVLGVSHAFVTDEEHKGKGVGRAMYEAMMAEGFAVRESRIGGQPGPMFFIPDECSGAGNTSAEARRVWASLVRDYPSQGTSIRVDAPPVVGSRKRTNPRWRRNAAYSPLAGGSRGKSAVVQDSQTVVSADGLRRATGRNRKVSTSDWTTGKGHFDIVRSWVLKERGADGKLHTVASDASLEYAEEFLGMTIPAHLRLNPSRRRNPEDDNRMAHQPDPEGTLAHELWREGPPDVMTHPEWYTGFPEYLRGFWPFLRLAQKRPTAILRIYRALPTAHTTFREGDWVTLSREYAQEHLDGPLDGKGHILVAEVPADTLRFAGDDLMEWGYWGPSIKGTPVRRPTRRRPARRRNPAPTSDAFREWFRNSKIVDENGEPLVVYHGGFDVLNSRNGTFRKSKTGSLGSGIYFTPDRSAAEYYMAHRGGYEAVENGVITEAYLSVQNPLVVRPTHEEDPTVEALVLLGESRDRAYDKVEKIRERFGDMGATLPNAARAAGYDGIIRIGWRDGKVAEIVVFEPWQVKSATRNAGTYYPYGSDIRTNPDRSSSAREGRKPTGVR
jgi:GNAT superfamily N-acetyltransferase